MNCKILNGGQLKLIAITAMLMDHAWHVLFFPDLLVLKYIGRIAFPIFCFLLAEGARHTKNAGKYLLRLGAFGLISEIPFDMALNGEAFRLSMFWSHTNVFYTLFLGMAVIYLVEKWNRNIFLSVFLVFCGYIAAELLESDYGGYGVLLIVFLYLSGKNVLLGTLTIGVTGAFLYGGINACQIVAALPIGLYNGKRGKNLKYFFYWFYPAHMVFLYLLSRLLA